MNWYIVQTDSWLITEKLTVEPINQDIYRLQDIGLAEILVDSIRNQGGTAWIFDLNNNDVVDY